jgi:hypothetical protein
MSIFPSQLKTLPKVVSILLHIDKTVIVVVSCEIHKSVGFVLILKLFESDIVVSLSYI